MAQTHQIPKGMYSQLSEALSEHETESVFWGTNVSVGAL